MTVVACARCAALHAAPGAAPSRCPACGAEALQEAPAERRPSPERRAVGKVDAAGARKRLADAAGAVWYATPDLAQAASEARVTPLWWPHWLCDVDAVGIYQAELGFDEEVESSQEVYEGGRWSRRTVTEQRARWEPRVGRLQRRYDNLVVPALAGPQPAPVGGTEPCAELPGVVRLPDRAQAEQWPAVLTALREAVGADLVRAAGADHVRELFLELDGDGAHWTLLLAPAFATWYADDDGVVHVLTVDGTTGEVRGPRLASVAAGRKWAGVWFVTGGVIGGLGLLLGVVGLIVWVLLPGAGVMMLVGALVAMVGLWPLFAPAAHNRGELQGG
ncbi:MAG: hypothetical protein R3F59_04260 [Myxococcota bacterium]